MKSDIDLEKYYDATEVENYDVFIGPNGEYYKVRNIMMKNDSRSHYIWAEYFFSKEKIYQQIVESKRDILSYLISEYGYIRYSSIRGSRNPIIDFPNSITKEQKSSLYKLLEVKEEYLNEEQSFTLENNDISKNLSSNYFIKRISMKR